MSFPTENSVMTVRRYSTSSIVSGMVVKDGRIDKTKQSSSAWGRLREEMQPDSDLFKNSDKREVEEEVTNRHSLQEYVQKNRCNMSFSIQCMTHQKLLFVRCFIGWIRVFYIGVQWKHEQSIFYLL